VSPGRHTRRVRRSGRRGSWRPTRASGSWSSMRRGWSGSGRRRRRACARAWWRCSRSIALACSQALRRCVTTTNIIDSSHAGVRQHTNRVSRWRNEAMAVRWAAVTENRRCRRQVRPRCPGADLPARWSYVWCKCTLRGLSRCKRCGGTGIRQRTVEPAP